MNSAKHSPLAILFVVSISLGFANLAFSHGEDPAYKHDNSIASAHGLVLGHNGLNYQVDLDWAKADPSIAPVINSHAMTEGRDGLSLLVQGKRHWHATGPIRIPFNNG
jgi:hypothetical protein